jgi:hypothetical protein
MNFFKNFKKNSFNKTRLKYFSHSILFLQNFETKQISLFRIKISFLCGKSEDKENASINIEYFMGLKNYKKLI